MTYFERDSSETEEPVVREGKVLGLWDRGGGERVTRQLPFSVCGSKTQTEILVSTK